LNDGDNPAPTLDSPTAQTILETAAPTPGDADATLGSDPATEATAKRDLASIGPYRLVKKIGEGGMGQVWLAEQTEPVRRQVALKLIKVGMYDEGVLKRFQAERQSLAIMDHPSIAKVFDAGTTPDGQPYFVMEYVPGVPITEYCDQKRLRIRERLELFIKVCEAVQHAHQKAIIHRDLKPPNIMVVEVDGKPVPRIIDFGLAKATTPKIAGETMFTQVGSFVGTPGYMSPEQADTSLEDVDTRTDVYSLGVVLYVLLTGSTPFDPKKWQRKPLHEVLRHLREDEPPRPSTKIGMEKDSSLASAEMRDVQPKQLANLLRGDLDWITMKALEKDRTRRYGTPSELAGDISRNLRNEPVTARPASNSYRLQKYVRRHRVGVIVAAGLLVLLSGFAVAQEVQLRRIIQERDRTARERDRASRITEFMTKMFMVSDPSEARGNSVTAREILDKASKDIDTGLAKDPELQAQLMHLMGTVYDKLGLYPRAESLLRRAVDIRLRVLGPQSPDSLRSAYELAWVLSQQGRYAEAEKLARETVETERRVLGPQDQATLDSMTMLASVFSLEGRLAESELLNRQTLEIERRVLGPEHPDTIATMDNLATVLDKQGHHTEAERTYRETLDIERHLHGSEHPDTLESMNNLAGTLAEEGHYAEAEKLFRETLEIRRRVLGPEHPKTAETMYNLGCVAAMNGERDEALYLLRQAIDHGLPPEFDLELNGDDDLKSLDGDPRFLALVYHAKERAAVQKQN